MPGAPGAGAGSGGAPRVLLVDLDGTLVGRVDCAACEYELIRATRPEGSARARALADFRRTLTTRMRYGIIRPHVEAYFKAARAQGVEVFVYTASDPDWAAVVVPCAEAALGVRFNRPLLTRRHCECTAGAQIRKSLARVLPVVARALRPRHGGLGPPDALRERVTIIDNTPDVFPAPGDAARLVVCPTYSYAYVYDVLARVDVDTLHRGLPRVMAILRRCGLFPSTSPLLARDVRRGDPAVTYQEFAAEYYAHLARLLGACAKSNAHALAADRFWARALRGLAGPS